MGYKFRSLSDGRRRLCLYLDTCVGNETDPKPHYVKDDEKAEGIGARMVKLEFDGLN
jgi:hypothetical protein